MTDRELAELQLDGAICYGCAVDIPAPAGKPRLCLSCQYDAKSDGFETDFTAFECRPGMDLEDR